MINDEMKNNPLVQADIQSRQQQPMMEEEVPSREELIRLGEEGMLSHMGGKLPDFLSGIITEAKDMAKNE